MFADREDLCTDMLACYTCSEGIAKNDSRHAMLKESERSPPEQGFGADFLWPRAQ